MTFDLDISPGQIRSSRLYGLSLWSQEENVAKLVDATSSEGFF